jgi:hypothetical protein
LGNRFLVFLVLPLFLTGVILPNESADDDEPNNSALGDGLRGDVDRAEGEGDGSSCWLRGEVDRNAETVGNADDDKDNGDGDDVGRGDGSLSCWLRGEEDLIDDNVGNDDEDSGEGGGDGDDDGDDDAGAEHFLRGEGRRKFVRLFLLLDTILYWKFRSARLDQGRFTITQSKIVASYFRSSG